MRKVLIGMGVALLAGIVTAGDIETKRIVADFTTPAQSSNAVATAVQSSGYVQEIVIIPTGTFTSKVDIVLSYDGGTVDYVYTNDAVTATTVIRPRVDATDNAGTALTSDDPTRYLINGGTLTVNVTNVNNTAATSLLVLIKTEK